MGGESARIAAGAIGQHGAGVRRAAVQRIIHAGREACFGIVIAAGGAALIRAVLAADVGVLVGRSGADIVKIAGAAATRRSVVATDERRARIVVAGVVWRCYRTGELAIRAERPIAAVKTEAATADLIVTTRGVVVRRYALARVRVARFTFGTTRFSARVDALAGIRILMLTRRTLDRRADTTTNPVVERLSGWALIVHAALLAADLVRATCRPILLAETRIADASIRVSLLTLRAGIVAGSLAAALVIGPAAFRTDGATIARFLLGRFVSVGAGLRLRYRRVVNVRIGIAAGTHIPVEVAIAGIRRSAGGTKIRQEVLIAGAFLGIAGVVADVMIVAGRGEVNVAIRADLIGNDAPDKALFRSTAVERRHMTGMRHAIGAEGEVGDRMAGLHPGRFTALQQRLVGHAIAVLGGCQRRARRTHARRDEHRPKCRAEHTFQHLTAVCCRAQHARQFIKPSFFHSTTPLHRRYEAEQHNKNKHARLQEMRGMMSRSVFGTIEAVKQGKL